ncbi:MAG: hypothetical protein CMF50_10760 [Legionellales bacterium]|nr:hypothetical protein [Legionellales bacterium]|tara:strand:+ start:104 stop:949 length:846 start_codon:yes stop_codon:yes gene_type:complete
MPTESLLQHDGSAPEAAGTLEPGKAREPLSSLQSYCQSKTFIAKTGVNPLIAAASALFSLISKLKRCDSYNDIDALRQNLIHEIKAFECAAQTRGYRDNEILAARYAMCCALDETIQGTAWGMEAQWHANNLLHTFQGEAWGGDRFFMMLDRLRDDAQAHIDLLEFIYICLSFGFAGKFRNQEQGGEQLINLIDELYRLIRDERGDYTAKLAKAPANDEALPRKKRSVFNFSPLTTAIATGAFVATIYLGYSYVLNLTSTPLEQRLNTINAQQTITYETAQ